MFFEKQANEEKSMTKVRGKRDVSAPKFHRGDYRAATKEIPGLQQLNDERYEKAKSLVDKDFSPTSAKSNILPAATFGVGGGIMGAGMAADAGVRGKGGILGAAGLGAGLLGGAAAGLGELGRRKQNNKKEKNLKKLRNTLGADGEDAYGSPNQLAMLDAFDATYKEHYASDDSVQQFIEKWAEGDLSSNKVRSRHYPGEPVRFHRGDWNNFLENNEEGRTNINESKQKTKENVDKVIKPTKASEVAPYSLGLGGMMGGATGSLLALDSARPNLRSAGKAGLIGAGVGAAGLGGLAELTRRKNVKDKRNKGAELLRKDTELGDDAFMTPREMINRDAFRESYNEHYASTNQTGLSKMAGRDYFVENMRNQGFHNDLNYIDPEEAADHVNVARLKEQMAQSPEMQRAFNDRVRKHEGSLDFKVNNYHGSNAPAVLTGLLGAGVGAQSGFAGRIVAGEMGRNLATRQQAMRSGGIGAGVGALGGIGLGLLTRNATRKADQKVIDAMDRPSTYADVDSVARGEALKRRQMAKESSHRRRGLLKRASAGLDERMVKLASEYGSVSNFYSVNE